MSDRPRKPTLDDLDKLDSTFTEIQNATDIATDEVNAHKLAASGAKVVSHNSFVLFVDNCESIYSFFILEKRRGGFEFPSSCFFYHLPYF